MQFSMNEYNKLVRDRIPEIIHRAGEHYAVKAMSEEEYQQALRHKLVEEASEAAQTQTPQELVTEMEFAFFSSFYHRTPSVNHCTSPK
jgi:predicted house-cleaning noncanonical NTP pyrophosphatase (MazG superfamily)